MHTVWKMEKKYIEINNLLARKGKNEPDSLNPGKKNKEQA